jgi:hypothetical protein
VIIAHTDKGDHDARGSSVIEDNADFVLHCVRVENDLLEVEVAKRKDAEDGWTFAMGVTEVDLDFGGTSLILHDYEGSHYSREATEEDLLQLRDKIHKFLLATGNEHRVDLNRKEIAQFVLPRGARGGLLQREEIDAGIERLETAGILELAQDSRGGKAKTWKLTQNQIHDLEHFNPPLYTRLTGALPGAE